MESLEELKAIRDGAPEGLEHDWLVDSESIYWITDGEGYWYNCIGKGHSWHPGDYPMNDLRSESDINRIIELMEFIDEVGLDLMLELRGKVNDNSDERINQIARNGGDGEHYD